MTWANRARIRHGGNNCFNCGKPGHYSRNCRLPRKTWAIGAQINRRRSRNRGYNKQKRSRRIWSNEQFDALQTARIFHRNNGNPEVCTYGVAVSSEAWGGSKKIRDLEKDRETQGEKIRQLETGIDVQNSVIEELRVKLTNSESAFQEIDSKFHEWLVDKNQLEQKIVTDQYAHPAEMCSLNEVSNTSHFPLLKSWETTKIDLFMKGNKECGLKWEEMRKREMVAHGFYWGKKGRGV